MMKLFNPGMLTISQGVHKQMMEDKSFRNFIAICLGKHLRGDWGNIPKEDKDMNDEALKDGFRLVSAYEKCRANTIVKVYIITEADRSATTIIFPEEY